MGYVAIFIPGAVCVAPVTAGVMSSYVVMISLCFGHHEMVGVTSPY